MSFVYLILSTKLSASLASFAYTAAYRSATKQYLVVWIYGRMRTLAFQRCHLQPKI